MISSCYAKALVIFLWSCSLYPYSFPVLDPSDPKYIWVDDLVERDFVDKLPITKKNLRDAIAQYEGNQWYQHFKIKDNRVEGPLEPCLEFKNLLEYLCECYTLPDLELIIYCHDGLFESPVSSIPIFARSRRIGITNSILLNYGYGLDWVDDMCNRVEEKIKNQNWDALKNKVHWRGNTTDGHGEYGGGYTIKNWTSHPRGKACWFSLKHPDLIDAAFVFDHYYGISENDLPELTEEVVPRASRISFEECLDYKYQLLISGVIFPWTSDWKIHAGRVVFLNNMPWEVYWSPLFNAWEHFIPVAQDYSDFIKKVLWAENHKEECKSIANRSREFMQTHAKPEHMALYCYKILIRYAKMLCN